MSIFQELCAKFEDPETFFREDPGISRRLPSYPVEFKETLIFSYPLIQPSPKDVFLTKNYLYFYTPQGTLTLIYLKWCTLRAFVEESSDQVKKFGFTLESYGRKYDFYAENEEKLVSWIEKLSYKLIMTEFDEDYIVIKLLDSGQFGRVFLCQDIRTRQEFAVKKVNKSGLARKKILNYLFNEISIQRKLVHPNIVQLYKVYEEADCVCLVVEFVPQGNLYTRISEKKVLREDEVMRFVRGLILVLGLIHSKGIIHKDLKPENILMTSKDTLLGFKIADFGLSSLVKNNEFSCSGSLGYMAPEMLRGKQYTNKVDIFSVGIIAYTLLTGCIPFNAEVTEEVIKKNISCQINFNSKRLENVSKPSKLLLKDILNKNPIKRPSADQILRNLNYFQKWSLDISNSGVYERAAIRRNSGDFSNLADFYSER